jgi:hypothetical protein
LEGRISVEFLPWEGVLSYGLSETREGRGGARTVAVRAARHRDGFDELREKQVD